MLFLRLMFIGGFAIAAFIAFLTLSEYQSQNDSLNDIVPAAGSIFNTVLSDPEPQCMPESIGNTYFKISTPPGFCSCLADGMKMEKEIIESGSSLVEYNQMCVDVSYEEKAFQACLGINNVLEKRDAKSRVDCGCFFKNVKAVVVSKASLDGKYEVDGNMPSLMDKFNEANASKDKGSRMLEVPKSIIKNCMK